LRKAFLIAFFASFSFQGISQDVYRFGLLPVFNTNAKLKNDFSLNVKLENRHILSRGTFNGEFRGNDYRFERQDIAGILAKKLSANTRVGAGYLFRLESERVIHRLIQQISFTQPLSRVRIAHRFSSDQTWDPDEAFEFRLRYRIGFEVPLVGTQIDPNELYFKSNLEYLARFQDGFINEFRAIPALGYLAKNKNSFELGLDYRVGTVFEPIRGHGFWIYLGYYLRI
jgi:hypothetical protein